MLQVRTLHRDISKYNQLETAEEAQEETGWKLVRGREMAALCFVRTCAGAGLVHGAQNAQSPCLARPHVPVFATI